METYESEYTLFMRDLKAQNPQWASEQQEGLELLWDKKIDDNEQRQYRQAKEANRAYPYDVNFG